MSRHSIEFIELSHLVPHLVDCIEGKGRAKLAQQPPMSYAHEHRALQGGATVYSMLALELDQSAEAVRQEMHKYRTAARLPSASKLVRLVDAAARLGWISRQGLEERVRPLVRWCYAEDERLQTVKRKRSLKAELRTSGKLLDGVRLVVEESFRRAGPESMDDTARELLTSMAVLVGRRMAEAEVNTTPQSAAVLLKVASEVGALLNAASLAIEKARDALPQERRRELDAMFVGYDAERVLTLTSTEDGMLTLQQRAHELFIGDGQLSRILRHLSTGKTLGDDDLKRRDELLASCAKLRKPLKFKLDSSAKVSSKSSTRTWAVAKSKPGKRSQKPAT
jgi:hypothetical protein